MSGCRRPTWLVGEGRAPGLPGSTDPSQRRSPPRTKQSSGAVSWPSGPAVDQVSSSAAEFALELELQIAPALYVIWVLVGLLQI